MVSLSADQEKALSSLLDWFSSKKGSFVTLGGYAGTGKTTLISVLRQKLHRENKKLKVAFCSYTGKATRVLRSRLVEEKVLFDQDSVGTIHSLIYSPVVNEKTQEIIGWKLKEKVEADLIVIDEASMVDGRIWGDLCSFKIPIIAVGDHGQLPPIRENFNLMEKPVFRLEEIHRQAKGNPIIQLSVRARKEGDISPGKYGERVVKKLWSEPEARELAEELLAGFNRETLILCGYNSTRVKLNNYIRGVLGFESLLPSAGDRVICLRNNHEKEVFNGMLGRICTIGSKNEEWYEAEIEMDGEESLYQGLVLKNQFNQGGALNFTKERFRTKEGDLFDFGYALTVHKAQGSQAKRVILLEERFKKMDDEQWRRWLYTAVTRAQEELFIFG